MSVDSFPVAFPITNWTSRDAFDPMRRQMGGVIGSGRDFVIDRGAPYWKIGGKTRPLFPAEIAQMEAFKSKLRGAGRYFTAWDPVTQYPAAYMPAGPPALLRATIGGSFDGHCTLSAIANSGLDGVGRDVISLGAPYALPTGLPLIGGDKIELRQGANLLSAGQIAFTSGWTAQNCAITANTTAVLDPAGGNSAAAIARTAGGAMDIYGQFAAPMASGWYRFTVWLALGSLTGNVGLTVEDATPANATTISVAPQSILTLAATDGTGFVFTDGDKWGVSGAWQRFDMTAYMPAGSASNLRVLIAPALAPGSAGDSFYAWAPAATAVNAEMISLHRVLDTVANVADANGNLTAWIEPEVPASLTAGFGGALANIYKPRAKFRMLDLQIPVDSKGRARPGEATFSAVSTLN
jgi:hypothetical protein